MFVEEFGVFIDAWTKLTNMIKLSLLFTTVILHIRLVLSPVNLKFNFGSGQLRKLHSLPKHPEPPLLKSDVPYFIIANVLNFYFFPTHVFISNTSLFFFEFVIDTSQIIKNPFIISKDLIITNDVYY